MSFVKWREKTKLLNYVNWMSRPEAETACQAAYKAGVREGRKQVDVIARAAIALRDKLK